MATVPFSSTALGSLAVPGNQVPLLDSGQHTEAWARHFQDATDRINTQTTQIGDLTAQLAQLTGEIGKGVVDGSDATAGDVGEYMQATGSLALTNNAGAYVASLNLTAGDWDVSGNVAFNAGSGTHLYFGAGVGTADTYNYATFPGTAITPAISTATRRYSLTATTAVPLQAVAGFTGTCNASGTLRARRIR